MPKRIPRLTTGVFSFFEFAHDAIIDALVHNFQAVHQLVHNLPRLVLRDVCHSPQKIAVAVCFGANWRGRCGVCHRQSPLSAAALLVTDGIQHGKALIVCPTRFLCFKASYPALDLILVDHRGAPPLALDRVHAALDGPADAFVVGVVQHFLQLAFHAVDSAITGIVAADVVRAASRIGHIPFITAAHTRLPVSIAGVADAKKLGDDEIYKGYPTTTWLLYYRLKSGMTQAELSKKSGIYIRQIQKVESGEIETGNMAAKTLFALADALGVDISELL